FAAGQSLLDDRVGADVSARNDLTSPGRQVGPDQVYVRSRLTRLDGWRRYEDRVPFGRQGHDDVDELTGPETPSLIREAGLEPDGPGRRVDHVVDERERSLRPGQRLPGGVHLHLQAPLGHPPLDFGELLLGNREADVKRRDLVDVQEDRVVALDQVAGVHDQVPRAAADRGADVAIVELQPRVLDGGPIGTHRFAAVLDGRPIGLDRRGLRFGAG